MACSVRDLRSCKKWNCHFMPEKDREDPEVEIICGSGHPGIKDGTTGMCDF